jgi:hypothetical protein
MRQSPRPVGVMPAPGTRMGGRGRCESPREHPSAAERKSHCLIKGWQIARSALSSNGTRSGGRIGGAEPRPAPPRCSTTLGLKSDAVTASAVAAQRQCYGATVGQPCRCDGATERCNTGSAGAVGTGNGVTNETADSLGSAVRVGACGAFVALLRNHAKIVRAHANRESPKPAARPFPVGSHSLSRCWHGGFPLSGGWCTQIRSQGVNARIRLAGRAAQQSVTLRAPWGLRRPSGLTRVWAGDRVLPFQRPLTLVRSHEETPGGTGRRLWRLRPAGRARAKRRATDHRSLCSVRS